jgi:hypothetical protein
MELEMEYRDWLNLADQPALEVYEECIALRTALNELGPLIEVRSKDKKGLILVGLFLRALGCYESSLLLLEHGRCFEAKVIARTLLEILFRSKAIYKDPSHIEQYLNQDYLTRKKHANRFKQLPESLKHAHGNPDIESKLQRIQQQIDARDAKNMSIEQVAASAGLKDYYDTAYAALSDSVHVRIQELEPFLRLSEAGELKEILFPDEPVESKEILLTLGESITLIQECVTEYLEEEGQQRFRKAARRFQTVGQRVTKS